MIVFPNAKINLGLNIVSKRPDGYHNLETIFYPLELCDALEVVPASNLSFTPSGIAIDGDSQTNLVMKAFHLLKAHYDLPAIAIYLQKNIPSGAGLGGGSTDAAFMLKLLNEFAELHLSNEQLEEYAAQLGADCPFFIQNQPVFAEGIGNIFSPVPFSLSGYYVGLVKPDIHVSTQAAYSAVKPGKPHESILTIIQDPVDMWKGRLVNDFEASVFPAYPAIGRIKEKLYELGAVYASMSGSGSTVFGIFKTPEKLSPEFPDCFTYMHV
ncbi:MAG: 4-diphosphocytidyl-2-C-methyl-D-erythritol kinase [Candidatus Ordinivivax streblomastigis]|uniref:4-diphosphocytidyl-2-C-methyl-D-erythritol kinase n=1 Tax=Candidatus Ordinivivax streblomastigis TaxID=2540710 RepID=A0A5M8P225_9BACT|nr:MAG: 4-diphosphocytidyl-2-C-methyl-D-erythritol kinase [Candidatus Ordinivivax streblomastigis]